ncbi:hypothetical protein PAPYR_6823 [Paratrimastix pyriformis]|uniref:F-box domain-containing protein n=1 Tax=Paratrimastix pyriformis TaxID=342808 RepID=A0ABQ8UID6_9EUKA|nr:hypothetical protein PAPYR_6823 [Paratrimastix pyriformis]
MAAITASRPSLAWCWVLIHGVGCRKMRKADTTFQPALPDELIAMIGTADCSLALYTVLIAVSHRWRALIRGAPRVLALAEDPAPLEERACTWTSESTRHQVSSEAVKTSLIDRPCDLRVRVPTGVELSLLIGPCRHLESFTFHPQCAMAPVDPNQRFVEAAFGKLDRLRRLVCPTGRGLNYGVLLYILSFIPSLEEFRLGEVEPTGYLTFDPHVLLRHKELRTLVMLTRGVVRLSSLFLMQLPKLETLVTDSALDDQRDPTNPASKLPTRLAGLTCRSTVTRLLNPGLITHLELAATAPMPLPAMPHLATANLALGDAQALRRLVAESGPSLRALRLRDLGCAWPDLPAIWQTVR